MKLAAGGRRLAGWSSLFALLMSSSFKLKKREFPERVRQERNPVGEKREKKKEKGKETDEREP